MNFKKVFMVFVISLFVSAVLIEAGFRFGMPGAVKQQVEELDEKVLEQREVEEEKTETPADTTALTVSSTNPIDDDRNIFTNRKITAIFSKEMDGSTLTEASFTLYEGTTAVEGTVESVNKTALFEPNDNLADNSTFTATIIGGVEDLAGNSMDEDKVWSFVTSDSTDSISPTVLNTVPADNDTEVVLNTNITATFSEAIDPTTITDAFTLKKKGVNVQGTATSVGSIASFDTTENLEDNVNYTVIITTAVADLAGNLLADSTSWSFTTSTEVAKGPSPVNLGTAGDFVILAKTAITTSEGNITGDIGISPAAASDLTGFSQTLDSSGEFSTSTYVTGKIYASDYDPPTPTKMTTAISDMEIAYTDAAGRDADYTELHEGAIGGKTLEPGTYKWGTGVSINSDVTLEGDKNDVWIFQVGEGITQASDTKVELTGGAVAENVFWQAADTVSIGTGATMEGVILAKTNIPVKTGAIVNGRLLAQTAVTLDANEVTEP